MIDRIPICATEIFPKSHHKEFYEYCLKNPREGMIIEGDKAYFIDTSLVGVMYREFEKSVL